MQNLSPDGPGIWRLSCVHGVGSTWAVLWNSNDAGFEKDTLLPTEQAISQVARLSPDTACCLGGCSETAGQRLLQKLRLHLFWDASL